MRKIRTLIIDDEAPARRTLRLLLQNDPDIDIVAECRDGTAAVRTIKESGPDLVFLDVQMPGMTGFEVLAEIEAANLPVVVFVTAYDQYALQAFEAHALDYLLKPFTDSRFRAALAHVKGYLAQRDATVLTQRLVALLADNQAHLTAGATGFGAEYLQQILVKSEERAILVETASIDWIEASDDYIVLHTGKQCHKVRRTMGEMERKLDPHQFVRIHRSAIVNMHRVKQLEPYFHGEYVVSLQDGTKLRLARRRREQFERLLGQSL
jgi:two-component system LytT family response regulator